MQARTPDFLTNVVLAPTSLTVPPSAIVCREGEVGDRLLLLDAGRAIGGAMVLRRTFGSPGRAVDLNALFVASNSPIGQGS